MKAKEGRATKWVVDAMTAPGLYFLLSSLCAAVTISAAAVANYK